MGTPLKPPTIGPHRSHRRLPPLPTLCDAPNVLRPDPTCRFSYVHFLSMWDACSFFLVLQMPLMQTKLKHLADLCSPQLAGLGISATHEVRYFILSPQYMLRPPRNCGCSPLTVWVILILLSTHWQGTLTWEQKQVKHPNHRKGFKAWYADLLIGIPFAITPTSTLQTGALV